MQHLDPITGRETVEYTASARSLYRHWQSLTQGLMWQTSLFEDCGPLQDLIPADPHLIGAAALDTSLMLGDELKALPHKASPFVRNMFCELDRILREFIREWELL